MKFKNEQRKEKCKTHKRKIFQETKRRIFSAQGKITAKNTNKNLTYISTRVSGDRGMCDPISNFLSKQERTLHCLQPSSKQTSKEEIQ